MSGLRPRSIAVMLLAAQAFVASAAGASGSAAWSVRTWQTDEGLPDNRVSGVIQAKDGYLWVATLAGLMRFDGVRFDEVPTYAVTKQPNQNVRSLLQDRRGNVWLAMDLNAVLRVGERDTKVINASVGLSNAAVRAMAEDGEGNLWLARRNAVIRIAGGRAERIGPERGVPSEGYTWVAADERGALWLACGRQVGVFRDGRFQPLLTLDGATLCLAAARGGGLWIVSPTRLLRFSEGAEPAEVARLPRRAIVRAVLDDGEGSVWIGTLSSGLLRWDGQTLEAIEVPRPQVTALARDREGNVWVGTDGGGLCRVKPRAVEVTSGEGDLPKEAVQTVCEDESGAVWAVLQYGALARQRGGLWHVMTPADGWPGEVAVCVTPARGGGVWVGMGGEGLLLWRNGTTEVWNSAKGVDVRCVRSLLTASCGDVWIVTDWPNRLRVLRAGRLYDVSAPKGMQAMIALAETADGTIWAGTSNGRLYRVRGLMLDEVERAVPEYPCYVRALHPAADGGVWIAYGGSGLGYWRDGRYGCLTERQGLPDRHLSQLLSDGGGRLWIAGNRGLFCAREKELVQALDGATNRVRCVAFGKGEGVANLQPMWQYCPTAWRTGDGRLLFAEGNGVLGVRPDAVRVNPVEPALEIVRVWVDGRLVAERRGRLPGEPPAGGAVADLRDLKTPLPLAPEHRRVEIEFTGLSFRSPENVQFRHRLTGFDSEWVEDGALRRALYPRLSAGRHAFAVTACNDSGVWSGCGAQLTFEVRPFFWQTWRFAAVLWLGACALAVAAAVAVQRRRHHVQMQALERQRAIEAERTRIARDMHDQLGSSLTKAGMVTAALRREPCAKADPRMGVLQETLDRMTETMDELVWAVNPRHDTVDGLASYVVRYAQEFMSGSAVACALDVPADLPARPMDAQARHTLFLAFEEALCNAMRHAQAGRVTVRMSECAGVLALEVEDDGCGFDAGRVRPGAHGLANMRSRLEGIGGRCEVRSMPGCGTRVRFELPLRI